MTTAKQYSMTVVTVGKEWVYGMTKREGYDNPTYPTGLRFKDTHHVVLNPICHRTTKGTTKEKIVASDCIGIDNQTWIALQYNLVIICFDACFNAFFKHNFFSKCTRTCMYKHLVCR